MTLNNDLIRKFAQMMRVEPEKKPTDVYGNILYDANQIFVVMDGNDTPIPIVNDKKYKDGDRVRVTIDRNRFTVNPL